MLLAEPTNLYDVLDSLVDNLPAILAAVAAIWGIIANNRRAAEVKADLAVAKEELKTETATQNKELGEVKVLVNGNLDREKKENARLKSLLIDHNIDPN